MKKYIFSTVLIGLLSMIVIAGEIPGSGSPVPPPPDPPCTENCIMADTQPTVFDQAFLFGVQWFLLP